MLPIYTGTQVRETEATLVDAGWDRQLMRKAAWGLAQNTLDWLKSHGGVYGRRVLGLIGKGKNGGDTLWALSFLAQRGVAVFAVPVNTSADALHTEAMEAFQRAGGRVVTTIDPATDAVIDGVFGTGFRGSFNLPGYLADHNLVIPETAGLIACDIPSGVNSDTGEIPGQALAADLTVTFGTAKLGLCMGEGRQHTGEVVVVDIGISSELQAVSDPWWVAEQSDIQTVFGAPRWDAHKYSRGVLSIVAGSPEYPGAAVLVVNAAAATGVGYISLLAQPPRGKAVSDKVLDANPQVVIEDHVNEKATAVVVGPGLGGTVRGNDIAATAIQTAIQRNLPLLVDASGLEILDQHVFSESIPAFVLTPHTGEMHKLTQRLAPDLAEQPTVEQAAAFAQRFGVWIVLKSADTFVLSPCGLHSVHSATTSQLATAGTGDSLSGMLGAAMSTLDSTAADLPDQLFTALVAGVQLHSLAGELAAADGGVVVSTLQTYIRKAKQHAGASS